MNSTGSEGSKPFEGSMRKTSMRHDTGISTWSSGCFLTKTLFWSSLQTGVYWKIRLRCEKLIVLFHLGRESIWTLTVDYSVLCLRWGSQTLNLCLSPIPGFILGIWLGFSRSKKFYVSGTIAVICCVFPEPGGACRGFGEL